MMRSIIVALLAVGVSSKSCDNGCSGHGEFCRGAVENERMSPETVFHSNSFEMIISPVVATFPFPP